MDWHSLSSHWMLSPFFSSNEKQMVKAAKARVDWIDSTIWISTSGTTRVKGMRWVGLKKSAFLASAKAVNQHLQVNKNDVWLNVLPTYHVGGLSIYARAFLSKSRVVDRSLKKWDAKGMKKDIEALKASQLSLVPTQVFDIVQSKLKAPECLRSVVVGGGALRSDVYLSARALGWPLLPSYGLSECASQVATASLESLKHDGLPELQLLSHVIARTRSSRLEIKSPALASFVLNIQPDMAFSLEDPRRDGWFLTEDIAAVDEKTLRVQGRMQDQVKVMGELVSIARIEADLRAHLKETFCVLAVFDARRGHVFVAVVEGPKSLTKVALAIERYQNSASGLYRLDHWYAVDHLPRSALGKLLKGRLLALLGLDLESQ